MLWAHFTIDIVSATVALHGKAVTWLLFALPATGWRLFVTVATFWLVTALPRGGLDGDRRLATAWRIDSIQPAGRGGSKVRVGSGVADQKAGTAARRGNWEAGSGGRAGSSWGVWGLVAMV